MGHVVAQLSEWLLLVQLNCCPVRKTRNGTQVAASVLFMLQQNTVKCGLLQNDCM
jgi:hypothetical protein